MATSSSQDTLANKWRKYIRNPKDKSYMRELPPEDFQLNTVTKVNPYVYIDELEAAKKEQEHQERVADAVKRRADASKTIKKKEKAFIKHANINAAPSWYQDLSTRQIELTDDLKNILMGDQECKLIDQTQNYLRDLGVIPSIKGSTVFKALKDSTGDPVKFLVMVQKIVGQRERDEYAANIQLIKRAKIPASDFSVNERLLLSAAFHAHFPVFTKKLTKVLPPPVEPPKVKWEEKKKKRKRQPSNPYLQELPIADMCWYEEQAYSDLKAKAMKKIARQEARDRYLESLKPKKDAEHVEVIDENDKDSEDWDDWLEVEDETPQEIPALKKLKKMNSLEELDATLRDDENYLIANPLSDTNLNECLKQQQEDTKKDKTGPQMPDILKYYRGYKDADTTQMPQQVEPAFTEDASEGIAAPEAHISAVVNGKLITKSSVASQTINDPGLGTLVEYLKNEQDGRAFMEMSSTSLPEAGTVKKKTSLTNGYNDYREEEPPETLINLMSEIREDLNLLRGVEKYTTYRTKSVESLLTLLSDASYLSVESYLYDSDYREGRSEEARKFKVERKKSRLGRVLQNKQHTSFTAENWDKSGSASSHEDIPMDEFTLVKKTIADLNPEDALEYAIRYLKDKGDPIAVLPGVHQVRRLEVWYNNRRTTKSKKDKIQEKSDLLEKSYHIWNSPYYKVSGMAAPEVSIPPCVTWDSIDRVKRETDDLRSKHFSLVKQQLVTNARNYFPSMFVDDYSNKLMKDFRRTFFAYLPSKEAAVTTFNEGKKTQAQLEAIAKCYQTEGGASPARKAENLKSRYRRLDAPQKKPAALSFAIAESPEK